jgi:hypothetical protein
LTNCTFLGNHAEWSGGGILNINYSSPTIKDCTFVNNFAGTAGGGVNNTNDSSPIMTNTIIWGNTSENGGGMHNYNSFPVLTNCTMANNTANVGGGIYNAGLAAPVVTNSIIWGNTPNQIANDPATVTYSDVQGGYAGIGNIDADPLFVDPLNGDFHLSARSPVIDIGNNNAAYLPIFDFEGDTRTLDGNNDGAAIVDMGMDEVIYVPHLPCILYVDQGATGTNNGESWANAFTSLQSALSYAIAGDQIWVADGIYKPTRELIPGASQTRTFQMKNGVAIYGGFAGSESNLEERDWVSNVTILSGDIGVEGYVYDNSFNVFYHPSEVALDNSAILDGFYITGGYGNSGAGMFNASSSPMIINCTFTGNSTGQYGDGGGMYNTSSSPILFNVTFSDNLAAYEGGGMYNANSSSPSLTLCTFSNNTANGNGGGISNYYSTPILNETTFVNNSAGYGAGMASYGYSSPSLTDCSFIDNRAYYDGGGIYNNFHISMMISNSVFSGNQADSGGGMYNEFSSVTLIDIVFTNNSAIDYGGGLANKLSSPLLDNCSFNDNSAGWGGGMANFDSSSPILTNCRFSGNLAETEGGGMYNKGVSPVLTTCTFIGNSANYGGAISNFYYASPVLTNCTFVGNSANFGGGASNYYYAAPVFTHCNFVNNSANYEGGGIYNISYSSPKVTNSILWFNSPDQIVNTLNSTPVITYCDVQGGYLGEGNIDASPEFVNPTNGDFHLSSNSPAIDAGTNSASNLPALDFEGDPRILDGNGDGVAIVDMGVDEYNPESSARSGGAIKLIAGQQPDKVGLARLSWQPVAILAVAGFYAAMPDHVRKYSARNIPR